MIAPADPLGTRPLRGVEPVSAALSAGDPQREAFSRLTQIALGKMFQAEVLSRLDDGTHLIKIDNGNFKAALPGHTDVGEFITLKFVAGEPRPTFLMMPRAGADTASLSSAARLIGTILQAAQDAQETQLAAVAGKTPVLAAGSDDAPAMAAALKNALSMSGVFYESHLRQWMSGARPLAELRREAQARPGMPAGQGAPLPLRADASAPAQAITILAESDGAAHVGASIGAAGSERLSNEAMQLMNLQLQTLEQGKIVWQGELWPGQKFEWEIAEDRHQEQSADERASSWTSEVRFSLPALGTVCAHIRLCEGRVHMHLRAATEQTSVLLQRHGTELANALEAAGSPLDALTVKQDEQA